MCVFAVASCPVLLVWWSVDDVADPDLLELAQTLRSPSGPSSVVSSGRQGLLNLANPAVWDRDWVVHLRAAGDVRASFLATGFVCVRCGDRRPSQCFLRRWQGHVYLSSCWIELDGQI